MVIVVMAVVMILVVVLVFAIFAMSWRRPAVHAVQRLVEGVIAPCAERPGGARMEAFFPREGEYSFLRC